MRRGEDVPSTLKRRDMCNVPLEVMEVTTRKGTAGPMEWVAREAVAAVWWVLTWGRG